jgi:hypothetical protein
MLESSGKGTVGARAPAIFTSGDDQSVSKGQGSIPCNMTSGGSDAERATSQYIAQFVQRSLDSERGQYERLESRSATIVTTTGGW